MNWNYCVGTDIAKDKFDACIRMSESDNKKVVATRTFDNKQTGFAEFLTWIRNKTKNSDSVLVMMEATGVYYEDLVYFLYVNKVSAAVELPNKVKYFAKSHNVITKTDKVDAKLLALYGMDRDVKLWVPMCPDFKILRELTRERLALNKAIVRAKNQRHALNHAHDICTVVLETKTKQIETYESLMQDIEAEITRRYNANSELKARVEKITICKGIRWMSVLTVLCETNGFETFRSIRQVVSYTGLDVVLHESGKYKGKTRISKKGNSHIRAVLYMPALSAKTHNEDWVDFAQRIVDRDPKTKMKSVVAVMRKLLVTIFVLWKNDMEYLPMDQRNMKNK
ncbi:MAG: hypothetical protein RJA86_1741 [Pseudomonadota bacterium]|jgi:transposase